MKKNKRNEGLHVPETNAQSSIMVYPNHNPSNNNNQERRKQIDIRRPKPNPKKSAHHSKKMLYIRSAKSAPAIEFDVDDEADENPRPVG